MANKTFTEARTTTNPSDTVDNTDIVGASRGSTDVGMSVDALKRHIINGSSLTLTTSRSIVLIGDSWTAAELDVNPDNTADTGVFHNFNSLIGQYFTILSVAGVGGNTLAEMRARFQTDVIDLAPEFVWIQGGQNDIGQFRTADDMFADMQWMIQESLSNDITPLVVPCATTGAMLEDPVVAGNLLAWGRYNTLLMNYASGANGSWYYFPNESKVITDNGFQNTSLVESVDQPPG